MRKNLGVGKKKEVHQGMLSNTTISEQYNLMLKATMGKDAVTNTSPAHNDVSSVTPLSNIAKGGNSDVVMANETRKSVATTNSVDLNAFLEVEKRNAVDKNDLIGSKGKNADDIDVIAADMHQRLLNRATSAYHGYA